jgi:acyl transferase domain-containing protein/SAM-dependent methyltransferase
LDGLWTVLERGTDVVTDVPEDRFPADRFTDPRPDRAGKAYSIAGGYISDIAGFDTDYFGISPREAAMIDPQQRLILECAVEAFDDAGMAPADVAGSGVGVFIGVSNPGYGQLQQRRPDVLDAYFMSGAALCNTANRVSYVFDLHGPSMAIDTACASSLTALHQASEAVRGGQCPMAMVGGVNLLLNPYEFVGYAKASMLSATDRCHTFAAAADGYVRAEGAGVLLIKRLSDATVDGDRIHGVILATGANSDGRTPGLAAPNPVAQEALLRAVYDRAGVAPEEVTYVEAHGTGTPVGDPVECTALGQVLGIRHARASGSPLPIGSLKTNMGHLEPASGVAGVLKVLTILRHRVIPAMAHTEPLNPAIDFTALGLTPVHTAVPLPNVNTRIVAGVNSFGFGGANAHAVLAQPPTEPSVASVGGKLPIMVSARSIAGCAEAAERLAEQLDTVPADAFYNVAWTSARRRAVHEERAVVLAADQAEAAAALRALAAGAPCPGATGTGMPSGRIGFVFSGNGSQWFGMGASLLADEPIFRRALEEVDRRLHPATGWSVIAELTDPDAARLESIEVSQVLLFAMQVGMLEVLAARGVTPAAVAGHSVGEIAAAYAAGALDLSTAAQVIVARSRAQAATTGSGTMAAVGLSADEISPLLPAGVTVAAINTATDVTVAGDEDALFDLFESLTERAVFHRMLDVDHAFHTAAMDSVCEPLLRDLAGMVATQTRIPFVSSVTGTVVAGSELDASYWWRNVRCPVLFAAAVDLLMDDLGCDVMVEIGPHPVLSGYVRRQTAHRGDRVAAIPVLSRSEAGMVAVDRALAHLVAVGAQLAWTRYFPVPGRVSDLPSYPWRRQRCWSGEPFWWVPDGIGVVAGGATDIARHPLLNNRLPTAEPVWHTVLEPTRHEWLSGCRVGGAMVLSTAVCLDTVLSVAEDALEGTQLVELCDVAFPAAAVFPWDDPAMDARIEVAVAGKTVRVSGSNGDDPWCTHATGRFGHLVATAPGELDVRTIRTVTPTAVAVTELYASIARLGVRYAPESQVVTDLWTGDADALARYDVTVRPGEMPARAAVLEGVLQVVLRVCSAGGRPLLPVAVTGVRLWCPVTDTGYVHVRLRESGPHQAVADVLVADSSGAVSIVMSGCVVRDDRHPVMALPQLLTTVMCAVPLSGSPMPSASLRTPAEAKAACAAELAELADNDGLVALRDAEFGELTAHTVASAIVELLPDVARERGEFSVSDVLAAGVEPRFRRLVDMLLDTAVRHGLCRTVRVVPDRTWALTSDPDPGRVFRRMVDTFPVLVPMTAAYGRCGTQLAEVVSGRRSAIELFFADDERVAETLYRAFRPVHRIAATLLRSTVADWPSDRPLRILEVGGGTGSITADLLPWLPARCTRYVFTDISARFLAPARQRFAAYDFIEYRTLDLDRDPREQGFAPGDFDLVIAANAMHTAEDLTKGLGRVYELLADQGQLLLFEYHDTDLMLPTFGLLDSAWTFTDTELRGSIWPTAEQWLIILRHCGFTEVERVGSAIGGLGRDTAYSVLLASRGGREAPSALPVAPSTSEVSWLLAVAPDTDTFAASVATALRHGGHDSVRMVAPQVLAQQLPRMVSEAPAAVELVLVCGTGQAPDMGDAAEGVEQVIEDAVTRIAWLRCVATAAMALPHDTSVRIWVVLTGPGVHTGTPPSEREADAAIWGMARSLANEQNRVTVNCVALHRDFAKHEMAVAATALVAELTADSAEAEVVITPHGRFAPRTTPADRQVTGGVSAMFDSRQRRDAWPDSGEIVVDVRAVGLDERVALSAAPCSGVVTEVGAGVTTVAPGDRVFAFGSLVTDTLAVARADMMGRLPDGMSFAAAAALPVAYCVVHEALYRQARLQPGEVLLVRSATSAVGLAAVCCAPSSGRGVNRYRADRDRTGFSEVGRTRACLHARCAGCNRSGVGDHRWTGGRRGTRCGRG